MKLWSQNKDKQDKETMRNTGQTYSLGRGSEVTVAKRSETESAHENPEICKSASAPIKWVISEDGTVIVKKEGTVPVEEKTSAGSTGEYSGPENQSTCSDEKEDMKIHCIHIKEEVPDPEYAYSKEDVPGVVCVQVKQEVCEEQDDVDDEDVDADKNAKQVWVQPQEDSESDMNADSEKGTELRSIQGNLHNPPLWLNEEEERPTCSTNSANLEKEFESYPCPYCEIIFTGKQYLENHLKKRHPKEYFEILRSASLNMQTRQPTLPSPNSLAVNHSEMLGNFRPSHRCTECRKSFAQIDTLTRHQQTHQRGEAPCHCAACGKSFRHLGHLKTHQKTHQEHKLHRCTKCNKAFMRSGTLKIHQRTHTGETPYRCTECGKFFSQIGTLKTHQRVHSGETPFYCSQCGKKFSQIGNLKTHLRIHKGERPFHCSECGKSFIRAGTLKIHQRIHTGEYPYLCTECGSSFKESGALKSHQRIHTGERPYPCPECGKTFRRSGTLKIHQRLHTG
ncbi:gastrula zinc finger protein XlCGF57.1-like [Acipenser ruthenus]|uniref:gastrula zinc finger protein XlCGF57.1-like n=2 Tax=Acipenser ruthenus TaxID=7906 RepID=UPI0027405C1A|nr:gastrula zinc finger protein XlCGF57.1-like [Acipenser ruthenus]